MNSGLIQYSSGVNWEVPLLCSTLCSCSYGLSVFTLHLLRSVKAGSDGVYTTKMAKHAGTKVKTEEKYKVTATQTHIYKFAWRTKFIKNIRYHGNGV